MNDTIDVAGLDAWMQNDGWAMYAARSTPVTGTHLHVRAGAELFRVTHYDSKGEKEIKYEGACKQEAVNIFNEYATRTR